MLRWSRKMPFFILISCFAAIMLLVEPILDEDHPNIRSPDLNSSTRRAIHIDFKGAPPKLKYLQRILPILAAAGANTLLFEYEDMFPYSGILANLSATSGFSAHQIRELLMWAHDLGFEVIPLIQTFGHLEYALKLKEWSHLREVPESPQALCPTHAGTEDFIRELLKQVMNMHKEARFVHIGSDEVFHLGLCPSCLKAYGSNRRKLYEDHVVKVAKLIKESHPQITVLIWDDMIRQWKPQYLENSPLIQLVTPVVWDYTSNVHSNLFPITWWWYSQIFPKVWVASAYKGAELPDSVLPDVNARLKNQESWFELLKKARQRDWKTQIEGFALTGWSRFDHFAGLCEILPASLPSLILSLVTVGQMARGQFHRGDFTKKWEKLLSCPSKTLELNERLKMRATAFDLCDFPGVDAYFAMVNFEKLNQRVESLWNSNRRRGWITSYNARHNFTSPHISGNILTSSDGLWSLKEEVYQFKLNVKPVLEQYLDEFAVAEWMEQRMSPIEKRLKRLEERVGEALKRKIWPRRPLKLK